MSSAPPLPVPCPACGVDAGQRCLTASGRTTANHGGRIRAVWLQRRRETLGSDYAVIRTPDVDTDTQLDAVSKLLAWVGGR